MALVLVMEDEPNIALVLEIALSEEGHKVVKVSNGLDGMQRLNQLPRPDIVLTDLSMPGLSGQAVAQNMHSDPNLKDIPVVILTGSDPTWSKFPPRESYQAFLTKPFDICDVVEIVNTLTAKNPQPLRDSYVSCAG